ncbi:hypothetical protein Tco_1050947, partial [Tanacetum coccineum]
SPLDHLKDKSSLDASAKLTRAKPNKCSRDADLSKDKSGSESPPEFQRSWRVKGYFRSIVISSVLIQRYLRTTRQSQIIMTEDDEEKTGFHTEEGVYCFTHMPKELKNSEATLQRMIEKVRMRFETIEGSGWMNEAEKALQRIRRKLNKLQTLAVPKEGEIMMLCLLQKDETISSILMVNVITDGPMEEILKFSRKEGRLAKWAAKIRTYDISYIPRKEAKGLVVKKLFGRETIEEGSGTRIILVSPKGKMYSYAIRLKFNASNHAMDCNALLTGLAVSVPDHTSSKNLNSKAEVLKGLATIKLDFFYQEVLVGIKTRPSVEDTRSSKKGKATSNVPSAKPNYNGEATGSN